MKKLNVVLGVTVALLLLQAVLATVSFAQTAQPTQNSPPATPQPTPAFTEQCTNPNGTTVVCTPAQATARAVAVGTPGPTPTPAPGRSSQQTGNNNNPPLSMLTIAQAVLQAAIKLIGPLVGEVLKAFFGISTDWVDGYINGGSGLLGKTDADMSTNDPTVVRWYAKNAADVILVAFAAFVFAVVGKAVGPLADPFLPFSLELISYEVIQSSLLVIVLAFTGLDIARWMQDLAGELSALSKLDPAYYRTPFGEDAPPPLLVLGLFQSGAYAGVFAFSQLQLSLLNTMLAIGPWFMLLLLVPFFPLVASFATWWISMVLIIIFSKPIMINILGFGAEWLQGRSFLNDPLMVVTFLLVFLLIALRVTWVIFSVGLGSLSMQAAGNISANASAAALGAVSGRLGRIVPARLASMIRR